MKPTGQDSVAGVLEWYKEELKSAPSSRLELGKFFFAVSSASLATIVAFKKLQQTLMIDWCVGSSLFLLGLSSVVAILMVIPRVWVSGGETDLFDEHARQVRHLVRFIWLWFALWLLGSGIGLYGVLDGSA